MTRPFVIIACACLAFGSYQLSGNNLVANPGFETGDFTGWTRSGTDSSPDDNTLFYGIDTADAHSGKYGAYFGALGGVLDLSQLISTVKGDNYVISFWLSESPGAVYPYTNSFSASFGSAMLVSESDTYNFPYTFFTYDARATSDLTLLEFGFRDDVGFFSFDDVSVTGGVIAAPEPPSLALLPVALFALALGGRLTMHGELAFAGPARDAAGTNFRPVSAARFENPLAYACGSVTGINLFNACRVATVKGAVIKRILHRDAG